MNMPKREGYKRRVVANVPGRIEEVVRAGWHMVLDDRGKCIQQIIGTMADGSPKWGYLVEISADAYQARQEAKSRKVGYIVDNFMDVSGGELLTAKDLGITVENIGIHRSSSHNRCEYPD